MTDVNMRLSRGTGNTWLVELDCPAAGCGESAGAIGFSETGPFDGTCKAGHQLRIPYVKKGLKS